jgi:putative GTP pyrophosphokinase
MSYQPADLNRLVRNLSESIEEDLIKTGIFYRVFFRAKSKKSLTKKMGQTDSAGLAKYDGEKKFLRDLIGIRINLYFVDDLMILLKFFKEKYNSDFLEEAVDVHADTEFKPTRVNMIFRLPEELKKEYRLVVPDMKIDDTFELQLRTVFSEGWHEVEHDFRYKCQDDWIGHVGLSRTFNGMLAALETHEWGMIKVFEELSYSHYKSANYSAMIRMRLRVRTEDYQLSDQLTGKINVEGTFIKEFFKLERPVLIDFLLSQNINIPFTIDNLVYLINYFFIRNENIMQITPAVLTNSFKETKVTFEEI